MNIRIDPKLYREQLEAALALGPHYSRCFYDDPAVKKSLLRDTAHAREQADAAFLRSLGISWP